MDFPSIETPDKPKLSSGDWDPEKPSRALIACDGEGKGCVLWWVGSDLFCEIDAVGKVLEDLGLDNAPHGLSVWEGRYEGFETGNEINGVEWDTEPKGKFRELTDDEFRAIREGLCPWDESEWQIP